MLYYLFEYLDKNFDLAGTGAFKYISTRAALSIILSLTISMLFGKRLIEALRKLQVAETVRNLGLEGEKQKQGTPTMGGLIILAAILIPTLLFARINNVYILLIVISTIWLGLVGFLDDYIKVFKKNKEGLAGRFKILGQIGLGIIVGTVLYFNDNVKTRDIYKAEEVTPEFVQANNLQPQTIDNQQVWIKEEKATNTTIPFFKSTEFDYANLLSFMGDDYKKYNYIIFVLVVIFIITAVSNGANITDGIDGLAAGTSAIIGTTLGIFAYVSGNLVFSKYLGIMYIPHLGEMVIFAGAFVGACVGFLWYNAYPAQVFMGDTGSLALGGIIASFSIMVRKELLIPILCGIFLVENLSVMIQVSYFKYTKKKYGEGRRIFKMSPLHHHYQKEGYHESKIVSRFWIIGIMLAIVTILTLKIR
ncbi:MAG TPA: phospho-N-acetylmuramoyl-pentapeptide-transferase [Bacteroidia bacterium]|jgi:phospho-N-acetylmuramoyl-pentapeptide-transferase|nr:phospho-N-acetylmuramoyl-pentapeptide-transferase [Bacteroidia bacterium]MBP7260583.1 phospho-N-acetylmuramoyl-pentapeptide-transferase [Bacteroidia bacterium]MBP9179843.1 phospho-N-acetylmuramoyl-pentapeptide-transferase [Bacteroidia bacterium]MBP9724205.1 phospho-N-acetylmuramoyl-pentapeptide-transferase [Bacteroidia bacterium]HLP32487.1 phospho-N-acetylmuramoyl-pentapeptide-transferase [Bacteroidia bacterium]